MSDSGLNEVWKAVSALEQRVGELGRLMEQLVAEREAREGRGEGFGEETRGRSSPGSSTAGHGAIGGSGEEGTDEEVRRLFEEMLREQGLEEGDLEAALERLDSLQPLSEQHPERPEDTEFRKEMSERIRSGVRDLERDTGVIISAVEFRDENGKEGCSEFGLCDCRRRFLEVDPTTAARLFSIFANEQRLLLLKILLESGEISASDLQERSGLTSAGQFYHHIRGLASAGLLLKTKRGQYDLAPAGRGLAMIVLALGFAAGPHLSDIIWLSGVTEGLAPLGPEDCPEQ